MTAVVSTPKQESERVVVGSPITQQGSCFYFWTDPSVRILEIALDKYCHFYNVAFQELKDMADSNEIQFDDNIDFVLLDLQYNVWREFAKPRFEHDVFKTSDIMVMLDLAVDRLKMGGHVIVFCSKLQFVPWTEDLHASTESVALKYMNRKESTKKEAIFWV